MIRTFQCLVGLVAGLVTISCENNENMRDTRNRKFTYDSIDLSAVVERTSVMWSNRGLDIDVEMLNKSIDTVIVCTSVLFLRGAFGHRVSPIPPTLGVALLLESEDTSKYTEDYPHYSTTMDYQFAALGPNDTVTTHYSLTYDLLDSMELLKSRQYSSVTLSGWRYLDLKGIVPHVVPIRSRHIYNTKRTCPNTECRYPDNSALTFYDPSGPPTVKLGKEALTKLRNEAHFMLYERDVGIQSIIGIQQTRFGRDK